MANETLFSSLFSRLPRADSLNEAGGRAYRLEPKQALAQLAATGTFGATFYAEGASQLQVFRDLVAQVDDPVYLAKLAIYARQRALMKDMPAALLVELSLRDATMMQRVFDRVVDNGRVLRSVFQMLRSGQFTHADGRVRRGLSASLQRAFQRWLNTASVNRLLSASIGQSPRLRDVLRLARPTPTDNLRRALFGWLADAAEEKWAPATAADLPASVRALQRFRAATTCEEQLAILPELAAVRWDLLADTVRGPAVWAALARQMGPQALRMNLNTLLRHGVLTAGQDDDAARWVAEQIADPTAIERSRQFPYQFLAAYLHADAQLPAVVRAALQTAAELACGNVPRLPGPVVIGVDVSGSMSSPVTGRQGARQSSVMRGVDVAALFAAAILRRNPDSVVIPFDTAAYHAPVDPQDSILSLAQRLAAYGGGGTDCSLALAEATSRYRERVFAGAVLISDNESWVGTGRYGSTGVMTAWEAFVANQRRLSPRGPEPRLACIDLQPYQTVQAVERADIMNVGGYGDAVFQVLTAFMAGDLGRFVAEVEAIEL